MSDCEYYHMGVEIELIADPHKIRHPLKRWVYYEKLAASLQYHGLDAVADDLKHKYRKHSEHYDKWFITKDGSLGDPKHPAIPLEAVSPILRTDMCWEDEIDSFWQAWHRIFHMPRRSKLCGSHVHISPGPDKCFNLSDLISIVCGIVFYAKNLEDILPSSRRDNKYCQSNWTTRSTLSIWYDRGTDSDVESTLDKIHSLDTATKLKRFMQDNRRVLWNFEHVVPGSTGTIEFRGGRSLRGPQRTKWWIAFVAAFIRLCAPRYFFASEASDRPTTDEFWADIRTAAKEIQVDSDLPRKWRQLNESVSVGSREDSDDSSDSDNSSDSDESDASSIVSKAASLYSDSDCSTSEEDQMVEELRRERRKKCVIL